MYVQQQALPLCVRLLLLSYYDRAVHISVAVVVDMEGYGLLIDEVLASLQWGPFLGRGGWWTEEGAEGGGGGGGGSGQQQDGGVDFRKHGGGGAWPWGGGD